MTRLFTKVQCFFAAFALSNALSFAGPLADYVQAPESCFSWKEENAVEEQNAKIYTLKVTSQKWRTEKEINTTLWQHTLTVVVPKTIATKTVVFSIGNGAIDCPSSSEDPCNLSLMELAEKTKSVVCELSLVPNQPIKFSDESDPRYVETGRYEDALVAYTWDKFLKTGDSNWPLRLPMTKSVTKGMDAAQQFLSSKKIAADDFILIGRSKRGWTAWTAAAVDSRVKAIIPVVIDLLNLKESFSRHYMSYGNWSFAVKDYEDMGMHKKWNEPAFFDLMKIVEPFEYRDKFTMSKFIINASGDEFFLPDSSRHYFKDLPGEKLLAYVPNTGHFITAKDYQERVIAYINWIASGKDVPQYDFSLSENGAFKLFTRGSEKPSKVELWSAHNEQGRDFRVVTIGKAWKSEELTPNAAGEYTVNLQKPQKGWSAYLMQLSYTTPGGELLKVTTDVFVLPEIFPYSPQEN